MPIAPATVIPAIHCFFIDASRSLSASNEHLGRRSDSLRHPEVP
jgi:hypothetical protein